MKMEKIKPIPKKIVAAIKRLDKKNYPAQDRHLRFYSYMATNDKELVRITVEVRNHRKNWYCKQVIVHGVHSDKCFLKDIKFSKLGGYAVGWHDMGIQKEPNWYEDGEWGWQYDQYFNPWAPVPNKEYIPEHFPEYKYSAIVQYKYLDILPYLRIYEQYPEAEYFVKAGLDYLATCKSVLRQAKKDKRFRSWIFQHRKELWEGVYADTVLEAYKTGKPIRDTQNYLARKKSFIRDGANKPIRELFKGKALERFFSYMDKQNTDECCYRDYLRACEYLGIDMTKEKNLLPHDFQRWHDIRIDAYRTARAMEETEKKKALMESFRKVVERYLPLQYDKKKYYLVFIAMSPFDLVREGEYLHHCVGKMGYDQKMIRGESLIFFIRKKTEPTKPFVTVEYSPSKKRVLQCYADHNARPNEQIMNFVEKQWLPFANRQIKKLAA